MPFIEKDTTAGPVHGAKDVRPQKRLKTPANVPAQNSASGSLGLSQLPRTKKKGKLANLLEMPLDVLYEIFENLAPLDLLHLARTTKALRSVLLNKSATTVWKMARRSVKDFPEIPSDMSEPAYANLAFDTHCHNCLTRGVPDVRWALRVRYCKKCAKMIWPSLRIEKGQQTRSGVPDKHVKAPAPEALAHEKLCKKWQSQNDKQRSDDLWEVRKNRLAELQLLGFDDILQKMDLMTGEMAIRQLNEHPHVTKSKPLTERSWKNIEQDMIDFMEEWREFIAETAQIKTIDARRKVASKALCDFKRAQYALLAFQAELLLPSAVDFWDFPAVSALIKGSERPSVEQFSHFLQSNPDIICGWREEQIAKIIPRFSQSSGLSYTDEASVLATQAQLAIAVFVCLKEMGNSQQSDCLKPNYFMHYPEYLHHRCNRMRSSYILDRETEEGATAKVLGRGYTVPDNFGSSSRTAIRQKWSCAQLHFDAKASGIVKKILQACCLDWQRTSALELDRLDPRLVCLKCSGGNKCNGDRIMSVRGWRTAVTHGMEVHFGNSWVEWEKVCDADARIARVKEVAVEDHFSTRWRCAHCVDMPYEPDKMDLGELKDHLENHHGLRWQEVTPHSDYIEAVDVSPRRFRVVKMAPRATI
ncbi:hypothetical protein HWV62_4974 [Athelia sp. TMB]|nr:hypothetical protein HWV62_4974 [Athelia sp. TMB]